jgi:hypothetical protein
MSRIVWLFSLDCEQFTFLPLTTAGIKAYYEAYGADREVAIDLVHLSYHADGMRWALGYWKRVGVSLARQMVLRGETPIAAFSCYTWNMPTFLRMISIFKTDCPELLIIAGGPHVQHYEPYLNGCGIDVVVLGEGEQTFLELIDSDRSRWNEIPGVVFRSESDGIVRTTPRKRLTDLSVIPPVMRHLAAKDFYDRPIRWAAYESIRGCPFSCAFCQWSTGAIGVRFTGHSLPRVKSDLEMLATKGIEGILFCDSNFGAMSDDPEKADHLIHLKQKYGRPIHFATCWSKNHNAQVQKIVKQLHRNRLLEHYTMALQTLTPRALAISKRINMANYAAVVRDTVKEGVPIVSELIWGLPGETLGEFTRNLDQLTRVFPSHTIYPYALLPGTELFNRRMEYKIETVEMAPYGEARADYIISCLSYEREEGLRGYHLITAAILLYRGCILPLTLRYLAIGGILSMSEIMQDAFTGLLEAFTARFSVFAGLDSARIFEKREFVYRWILDNRAQAFAIIRKRVLDKIESAGRPELIRPIQAVLSLDEALCPRKTQSSPEMVRFNFPAADVFAGLEKMTMPPAEAFEEERSHEIVVDHAWDFGDSLVPQNITSDEVPPAACRSLRGRYPVWP